MPCSADSVWGSRVSVSAVPGGKRVLVIGVTGSGKTTFGENLGRALGIPCTDMDSLYWGPNWTPRAKEDFLNEVDRTTQENQWILTGNYRATRSLSWPRATILVWLDYPLHRVFGRLFLRTVKRSWNHELLWGVNKETFGKHLKLWSDDSLFYWLLKTYWRRKREIPSLLNLPEYRHLRVIRITNVYRAEGVIQALGH